MKDHDFKFWKTINGEDWKRFIYVCDRCLLEISHDSYLDQSDLDYHHNNNREIYPACFEPTDDKQTYHPLS